MKKYILNAGMFVIAVTAAFAFTTPGSAVENRPATQTVYYNTGVQTTCPNSISCSNVDNETACKAGVSTYYNSQSPCATVSAYKFKP